MAITFKVGFQAETNELKGALKTLQKDISDAFNIHGGLSDELQSATRQAQLLEKALTRATSQKGTSYLTLNSELRKAGSSAAELTTSLARGGDRFAASLATANTALALSNRQVITLNAKIGEMARVMLQSFKFTAAQSFIQALSSEIQEAYRWAVDLHDVVNEIGVVTGKTGNELIQVTQTSIAAAKNLRVAAKEYAQGALIFYQQGLDDKEVARRTQITIDSAKAAGTSAQEMSKQLTAVWNTYGMVGDEMNRAASVGAAMAAQTAVDFSDIAEAMQTAAAPASQMGVSYNSLAAIIATVGDTTQQSASVIGNAFKTIFSRFQQLRSEGTDGETTLGAVSAQLQELGVNVLDSSGELRALEDVIHEVGASWDTWGQKQQLAIAQLVGGTRQYGQFLALMNNYDKYLKNFNTAKMEDGSALEQQAAQASESIETYATMAGESWNRAFSNAIDTDVVKDFYSTIESAGNVVNSLLKNIGGLPGILTIAAGILANKIVPATVNAAANAKMWATSLTQSGRARNINREYDAMNARVDTRLRETPQDGSRTSVDQRVSLQAQKQMNEFGRQTAIINDKINTALKGATGEHKLNLQYMQSELKAAQELYQTEMDKLVALEKQMTLQKNIGEQEVKRAVDRRNSALTELQNARTSQTGDPAVDAQRVASATEEVIAANRELNAMGFNIQFEENIGDQISKVKNFKAALDESTLSIIRLETQGKKVSFKPIEQLVAKMLKLPGVTGAARNSLKTFQKELKQISNKPFVELKTQVEALGGEFAANSTQIAQMIIQGKSASEITATITSLNGQTEVLEANMKELQMEFEKNKTEELIKAKAALVDIISSGNLAEGQVRELQQALASLDGVMAALQAKGRQGFLGGGISEDKASATQIIGAVGNIAGAITMATGAVQMFAETWTKEGATVGEKIISLITLISMMAPAIQMAGSAFQMIGKSGGTMITTLGKGVMGLASKVGIAGAATASAGAVATAGWAAFLLIAVAVVAIIALITSAAINMYQKWKANQPEALLEKANEELEAMNGLLEDATSKANELSDALDQYENAVTTLENCVRGTDEWEAALDAVNQQVLTLLQLYPQLATHVERNADGMLYFDEEGVEAVVQEEQRKVVSATGARNAAAQTVADLENSIEVTRMIDQMEDAMNDQGVGGEFKSETEAMLADHMSEFAGMTAEQIETHLTKLNDEHGNPMQEKYMDEFVVAVQRASKDINAWDAAVEASAETARIQNEELAKSHLKAEGFNFNEDVTNLYGDLFNKLLEEEKTNAASKYASSSTEDVAKEFARLYDTDLTGAEYDGSNVTLGDGTEYTKAEMEAAIASANALERLGASAETVTTALTTLSNGLDEDTKEGFEGYLQNSNMNEFTQAELEGMAGDPSAVIEKFGGAAALQPIADALGITVTEFATNMANAAQESLDLLDGIGLDMSENAKEIFEQYQDSDFANLDVKSQDTASKMIQTMFENGLSQGAEAGAEILSGFGDSSEEAFDVLAGINWSDITPEELEERLLEAGVAADTFSQTSLAQLIDLMYEASGISFEAASENYNTLQEALEAAKTSGNLDADQIAALEQANIDIDAYFTRMFDGTYQLTGSAEEFFNTVQAKSTEMFTTLLNDANSYAERLELLQDADWSDLSSAATVGEGSGDKVSQQLTYLEEFGSGVVDEAQMAQWQDDLLSGALTEEEAAKIAEAVGKIGDKTDDLKTRAADARHEFEKLKESMLMSGIEEDLNASGLTMEDTKEEEAAIRQMVELKDDAADGADDYSSALLKDESALKEVAKEQTRFNEALITGGDNLEDWKKLFDADGGIKDFQKWGDAAEDMTVAYEGLLDLDGGRLSKDFAASAENLKLFETVLTGTEEEAASALKQLQDNALLDIHAQYHLDIDENELLSQVNYLQGALEGYSIGDSIGFGSMSEEFQTGLNSIIAACGANVPLINEILGMIGVEPITSEDLIPAPIGVQATAETDIQEAEGTKQEVGYVAQPGAPLVQEATITDGGSDIDIPSGSLATISIPSWDYVPQPVEEKIVSETPVTAYHLDAGTNLVKTSTKKSKIGGATPPSGGNYRGGSPKPSGGGSSSSAKKHKANKVQRRKKLSVEDRYSTIKSSIEDVQRTVDKLNEATDDAWGATKVKHMQKINKELQKQAKNYDALYKKAKSFIPIDQAQAATTQQEMNAKLADLGVDIGIPVQIQYDDDGFVANRTEIVNQLDSYLQGLYDAYKTEADKFDEAKSVDEGWQEQIDQLKEKYEDAQTIVELFMGDLDQVDETANEAAEALKTAVENVRTWMTNKVEEAAYRMEFSMSIDERDIELIDYMLDKWGDAGTKIGKNWDALNKKLSLTRESLGDIVKNSNRMHEIINNLAKAEAGPAEENWFRDEFGDEVWEEYISGNGGLPEEVMAQLEDNASEMLGQLDEMADVAREMLQQYMEIFEMYIEDFDRVADKLSNQNDKLDMYTQLLEFSGKKWSSAGREATRNLLDASMSNAKAEVKRAQAVLELSKQAAAETQGQLNDFFDDYGSDVGSYDEAQMVVYNELKAASDAAQDALLDAEGDMTSAIQDLADAAAEAIEQMAEVIKYEVIENLGGDFAEFGSMSEMFDNELDLETFFLRDYDKAYQLETLIRDVDDAMGDLTDPSRLEAYGSLLDEINAKKAEGVQVTQTDVDLLRAQFEIEQARDAYEEAKNAKNTMRLARDASGNWNYIYSADDSETEDAAQKLADAQYNYEKLLHEARDESSALWIQAQQEFFEFQESIDYARLQEDAQYKQEIETRWNYYLAKTELYANEVEKYNNMLGESFADTALGAVTNYDTMEGAQLHYTNQHNDYNNKMEESQEHFAGVVREVCEDVGIDYDELEDEVKTETQLMINENRTLANEIESMKNRASNALTAMNKNVSSWRAGFVSEMQAAQKAVESLIAKLQELARIQEGQMNYDENTDYTDLMSTMYYQEGNYGSETSMSDVLSWVEGNADLVYERMAAYKDRKDLFGDDYDANLTTDFDAMAKVIAEEIYNAVVQGNRDYFKDNNIQYGENASGKLHLIETASGGLISTPQIRSLAEEGPELVLNNSDTKNILAAVSMMRQVVSAQIGTIAGQTLGTVPKSTATQETTPVAQDVRIEASFPGVSVAAEIEEAFNNLVNQAVQYASTVQRK